MDEIVMKALAKWPNVPHCYSWLGLDARGQWYLRDEATQRLGPFAQAKGAHLEHEKFIAFIGRNYDCDSRGQWFFQNGPQRVYVELAATPLIWRLMDDYSLVAHTGLRAMPETCLLDELGRLYFVSGRWVGLLHSQDVGIAAEGIELGRWTPEDVRVTELPGRFGFVRSPAALSAGCTDG